MDLTRLIGVPYKWAGYSFEGCDCWGLCRIYYEMKGILLPNILTLYTNEEDHKDMKMVKNAIKPKFKQIPYESAMEGDICLFNIAGLPIHVSIFLDKKTFIHSTEGNTSSIERFSSFKYRNKLDSIWRPI